MKTLRGFVSAAVAVLSLASIAEGQTLLYRHAGSSEILERCAPVGVPLVPLNPPPGYPVQVGNPLPGQWVAEPTSSLQGGVYPLGDMAFDNWAGNIIETDGHLIAIRTHKTYIVPGAAAPTSLIVPRPLLGGPLTGLAADVAANILWCTDGQDFLATPLDAPGPLITALIPFDFVVEAPPMTGLDFESWSGLLVGCDSAGNLYRFTTGGTAVGPQPWHAGPGLNTGWFIPNGPQASDVAVPHAQQGVGGMVAFVQFLDGVTWGHLGGPALGAVAWTSFESGCGQYAGALPIGYSDGSGQEAGLALHYGVGHQTEGVGCGCGYASFHTTAPAVIGQPNFGFALEGVAPGMLVVLLGDINTTQGYSGGSDCMGALGLSVQSPIIEIGFADPTGRAVFPQPLFIPSFLAGLQIYAQAAFLCATAQSPFSVTRPITVEIGLP